MNLRWKIAQWFEVRWWKNYLHDKNKEDYLQWKKNYWNNILSKVSTSAGSRGGDPTLTFDSSKTICDAGCGPTGVFIALPENKITGVDPLVDEYEKHTPFFRKSDYVNTTFIRNTIEEFQPKEKFDLVFCMNAINHVHDIEKGFDKLKQVCSNDGTIILSVDAHNISLFKYLFRLVPGDILHPHQYNLAEYKSFLETRGMKILKTELLKKEFLFNHYLIAAQK